MLIFVWMDSTGSEYWAFANTEIEAQAQMRQVYKESTDLERILSKLVRVMRIPSVVAVLDPNRTVVYPRS